MYPLYLPLVCITLYIVNTKPPNVNINSTFVHLHLYVYYRGMTFSG